MLARFNPALPATSGGPASPAAAGRPADLAPARFDKLKELTKALPFDHNSKAVGGFSDIKLASNYLRVGNNVFNGHRIDSQTIACAAPIAIRPGTMTQFAAALVEQNVGLVVDLRAPWEALGADYRPAEQTVHEFDGQSAAFRAHSIQKGIAGYSDTAAQSGLLAVTAGKHQREIEFMNFPIQDYGARSAEDLDKIASAINRFREEQPGRRVAVHCRAGVGRTGMVLIAAELRQAYAKKELTVASREQFLDQAIYRLRGKRSNMMVQSLEQYRALDGYSKDLVAHKFEHDIRRDQARLAQPGRHALAHPPLPPLPPRPLPAAGRTTQRGAAVAPGAPPPLPPKPARLAAKMASVHLRDINLELEQLQETRSQLKKAREVAHSARPGGPGPSFLAKLVGNRKRDPISRFLDEKLAGVDQAIDAKAAEGEKLIAQRRDRPR